MQNQNLSNELSWVKIARDKIGTYEIVGRQHNPIILAMWKTAFEAKGQRSWVIDDETPWCGGFTGFAFASIGLGAKIPTQFPRALAWAEAGTKLDKPAYGCVVVFTRKGGGHVGIVVGKDKFGNIMVLGGNQSNHVSIAPFDRSRVHAYRWVGTQSQPLPFRYDLPLLDSNGRVSTNEA